MHKNIGLYFGSFNPIHIGHLAIANYLLEYSQMDELWFIISPQNPIKEQASLLPEHHRYEMVHRAIENFPRMRASSAEFKLPKPSYTFHTVAHLQEKHPSHRFTLIMGMDNLEHFHKWKNFQNVLDTCDIAVYPRPGYTGGEMIGHPRVSIIAAPLMEVSSSMLRKSISEGKSLRAFFPKGVYEYIDEMNFYKTPNTGVSSSRFSSGK